MPDICSPSQARSAGLPRSPSSDAPVGGDAPRVPGLAPEDKTYGSFAAFSDPDGSGWLLQEITTRLPGR